MCSTHMGEALYLPDDVKLTFRIISNVCLRLVYYTVALLLLQMNRFCDLLFDILGKEILLKTSILNRKWFFLGEKLLYL